MKPTIFINKPAPGFIPRTAPNRYTYDTWPKAGAKGHHIDRPDEQLTLGRINHHFDAVFFNGRTWLAFSLQDFVTSRPDLITPMRSKRGPKKAAAPTGFMSP